MTLADLSTFMRENGIVGAGGAGFPSYAKLNKKADTIILNCAECEPLLRLHRQLLAQKTFEIMTVIHTAITGVTYVLSIVIRSESTVKSAKPNGVTRLDKTIPLIIPRITQKELMRIRAKALLLKRYTKVRDAYTIKELYINTKGVFVIKPKVSIISQREANSTRNTINMAKNA